MSNEQLTEARTAMNLTLVEVERRKADIRAQIASEARRHEEAFAELKRQYAAANELALHMVNGIDTAQVMLAESVLDVSGFFAKAGSDRSTVIEDAVADLLNGATRLRAEYFGTKWYDHWYGQRSDHAYGCAPRHGSIVFALGLAKDVRESGRELTDVEIGAAIYYLRNLERIQKARADAAGEVQP